jgi:hypothetical protein
VGSAAGATDVGSGAASLTEEPPLARDVVARVGAFGWPASPASDAEVVASPESAYATAQPTPVATAVPIPSVTARAPIRPTAVERDARTCAPCLFFDATVNGQKGGSAEFRLRPL